MSSPDDLVSEAFDEHAATIDQLRGVAVATLPPIAARLAAAIAAGRRALFFGNGGSAADCQHLAAELVARFERTRRAIPAIALTTDTSVLTAIGNDSGFERIFERQVEALCQPGDVAFAISTSGRSPSVLSGARAARERGAYVVGLTGRSGGALASLCDAWVRVPSDRVARVQEAHILLGHILCDLVERSVEES